MTVQKIITNKLYNELLPSANSLVKSIIPSTIPVDASYTDYATSAGGFVSSATLSGMSLGAIASGRKTVAIVGFDRAGAGFLDLLKVEIDDGTSVIAGTKIGATYNNTDKAISAYIFDTPNSTTGDVIVTGNPSFWSCNVSLFRVLGASLTPFTTSGTNGATASLSTTIDVTNGGCVIAGAFTTGSGASTANYIWTGVTESQDNLGANSARRQSSGLYLGNAETGRTITANCSGSSSNDHALIAVSLSPA